MFLRQSTASQEIKLGPFLDDTDGKTAETGLTIANTDIKITKGGSTSEASKNSGGATHVASGRYSAVLDATDTDTVGILEIDVHVSGALPVRRQYYVVTAAVYDALFGGSSAAPAGAAEVAVIDDFLDTEIAAIKAKTDNLPADPADASDIAASFAALTTKVDTIDDFLDTEVAAIKAKTDNLPTDPADQSAVEAAITAATSPLATAANLATVAGYLDTEIAAILADTNELQTDWANGGRLDLILDIVELWSKRNAVLITGLLTGAGTNTEVYTISSLGITATCTTDSSGNRSAVVWS